MKWREFAPGYEVSDIGTVRSWWDCTRWHRRMSRPYVLKGHYVNAYRGVTIRGKVHYIHRLVLEAFVGPCPEGQEACHKNGDPSDNRLCNLRWDTRSANQLDKTRHGTNIGERNPSSKLTKQDVANIREWVGEGWSQRMVARAWCVCAQTVNDIVRGNTWRHI